jgi:hypothetical protein
MVRRPAAGDDPFMDERVPANGISRHRQVIGPLSDDQLIAGSGLAKRVAAAVGEGSAAMRSVHGHLAFGEQGTSCEARS